MAHVVGSDVSRFPWGGVDTDGFVVSPHTLVQSKHTSSAPCSSIAVTRSSPRNDTASTMTAAEVELAHRMLHNRSHTCGILGSRSAFATGRSALPFYSFKCRPSQLQDTDALLLRRPQQRPSTTRASCECSACSPQTKIDLNSTQSRHISAWPTFLPPPLVPFVCPPLRSFSKPTIPLSSRSMVTEDGAEPASIIADWFERTHESLPEGAISVQSSCSHSSPLPALLYGRGAWPATDLLFFMSDIPSTSQGETEGSAFRTDVANVFKSEPSSDICSTPIGEDAPGPLPPKQSIGRRRVLSTARSLLNLAMEEVNPNASPRAPDTPSITSSIASPGGNLFARARSLTKFEPMSSLKKLEQEQVDKVGPQFGFDLKKISKHYIHRRRLRGSFEIFSKGTMFPLRASSAFGKELPRVFAFCRFDLPTSNLVIAAINFSNEHVPSVCVSLKFLQRHYHANGVKSNSVVEVWNMLQVENDFDNTRSRCVETLHTGELLMLNTGAEIPPLTLQTLSEVLAEPPMLKVAPYGSTCFGLKLLKGPIQDKPDTILSLYVSSLTNLERLVEKIRKSPDSVSSVMRAALESNYVACALINGIKIENDVSTIGNCLHHIAAAVQWRSEAAKSLAVSGTDCKLSAFSLFSLLVDAGLLSSSDPQTAAEKADLAVMFFAKLNRILEATEPSTPSTIEKTSTMFQLCKECRESNNLGPIVFMTAELGKWSTVGGLGVMVDELAATLAAELGQSAWIISPYYDRNRKGERDYLKKDNIKWAFNVSVTVGGESHTLGVHEGVYKDVRLFFVHNVLFFPHPYPDNTPLNAVKLLAVIGKSFLEVVCHVMTIPQMIVTNDWTTGLIPAYAKHGAFGSIFSNTTFFHIIHNFDPTYEGRIFPPNRDTYPWVHGLPNDLIVDPLWTQTIINPSRCALLSCDNWGTVSCSYRDDLRGASGFAPSPLAPLLNRFSSPFATPNGIPINSRKHRLRALLVSGHDEAKGAIQKKYFGFETPDLTIPIFAFIGRITSQKGVHLILEAAESVIKRYNFRVQILIGGKVTWTDPYSSRCGSHMGSLKDRYPWSFYADPNEFFTDGTLVNLGADFGLMPSLFEPGGIVQQEFLVAGTPVIAYKTGGLKDTIFEFDLEKQTGNGFTFATYNLGDFIFAFERAMRVYSDQVKYGRLRVNCCRSVVSCEASASAWLGEFCRLRRKIMVNPKKVDAVTRALPAWIMQQPTISVSEMMAQERSQICARLTDETKSIEAPLVRQPVKLKYVPKTSIRPRSVAVSGSFDDWKVRRPLIWDNSSMAFTATLAMPPGRHIVKFIVDGDWVCCDEHPTELDAAGILNNVIIVRPSSDNSPFP